MAEFDSRIPLSITPTPMVSFGDLVRNRVNLQGALQQKQAQQQAMELNQVRADQERLDNDILRRKIATQEEDAADDEIYHQVLADLPPEKQDWKTISSVLAPKVKPRNLARYGAEAAKSIEAWGKLDTEKRKKVEDTQRQLGDALISVKAASPEQRQAVWISERNRLATAGVIDPSKVPDQVPDDAGLDTMIRDNGAWTRHLDFVKKEHANQVAEAKDREAREKAMHEEFATAVQGIEDAPSYDAAVKAFENIDEDHKAYANRFLRSLKFDPKVTPKIINRRAMSAVSRETADRLESTADNKPLEVALRRARAELNRDDFESDDAYEAEVLKRQQKYYAETERAKKVGAAGKGGTSRSGKDERGFTPVQVKADQIKHEALQAAENKAWRLAEAYQALLDKKDDEEVTDPGRTASTKKKLSEVRSDFESKLKKAREEALDIQRQKKAIRAIHGWDDATPAQAPAGRGSAPAATSAPAGVAKPAVNPGGRPKNPYR